MHRLGRIVALAGKNGSGKSRILSKLENYVTVRSNALPNITNIRTDIHNLERAVLSDPKSPHMEAWRKNLSSSKQQLTYATERVLTESPVNFKAIRFVPKLLKLIDPSTQPLQHTLQSYNAAKKPGLDGYDSSCLSYIFHLQSKWWNASHPNQSGEESDKQDAINDYLKFKDLISTILNTELGRNLDGIPTLYNQPIPTAGLSDGQKILLQICVAMHAQNSELSNTIFILDEPENHLHPSAVIDIIKSIYNIGPESQIWVATHSVPLLAYIAHIDPMSIWYVNQGEVSNAGRHPERVLRTLLGDQDRLEQLYRFAGLPSQLALTTYAAESLLPPLTLAYGANDPQVSQIQKIILNHSTEGPISILDIGAGKGRLLSGIAAQLEAQKKNIEDYINYFAYDISTEDKDTCNEVIKSIYQDEKNRLFHSREEFFSSKQDESISIAIMCNVFHEIPPQEWPGLFSPNSLINRAIKKDGHLMIVEDQRIPIGEMAHPMGFLVLDTSHLRTLFSITEDDVNQGKFLEDDARQDGRLKAHLISSALFERITPATTSLAIQQLRETAKDQIKKLRAEPPTYSNGQLHGFWTQQFANASLFADEH